MMRTPGKLLRDLVRHLRTEHTTSARLSLAVGVGLFVGTLPFYGFHLLICVALSWLLGLNKATTYLAANISNPFLAPFLILGSVQIGERLLHSRFLPLGVEDLGRAGAAGFFGAWLVGGIVLGAGLGALGGIVTYAATTGRRRRACAEDERRRAEDTFTLLALRTAERYRRCGAMAHGYVHRKLLFDPVFRALLPRIPAGAYVLDVGCGRGQFAVLLALDGDRRASGVDWDEGKIGIACLAGEGLPVRFETRDLSTGLPAEDRPDVALVLDVLHFLPAGAQNALLRDLAGRLAPHGTMYVRDVDVSLGLRSWVTRLEERIFTAIGFNRGKGLHFRTAADFARVLEACGLSCSVEPMWQGTPFANVLIVGRRP